MSDVSYNCSLTDARRVRNDEFYTLYSDIELELCHYSSYFRGKRIYCNCDNPFYSQFFYYFVNNFNRLGLSCLESTCYSDPFVGGRRSSLFSLYEDSYHGVVTSVPSGFTVSDVTDVSSLFSFSGNKLSVLSGRGDFAGYECVNILKDCDIVVTNPPFSLFREYISLLTGMCKSFVVVGNINAVTYSCVFPLLRDDEMWLGMNLSVPKYFTVPFISSCRCNLVSDGSGTGTGTASFGNICWFTDLDIDRRHVSLELSCRYSGNESSYPFYDNYAAIEVSRVSDIPNDYFGIMGVPVTFFYHYNPEQFRILGNCGVHRGCVPYSPCPSDPSGSAVLSGRVLYERIFIIRR